MWVKENGGGVCLRLTWSGRGRKWGLLLDMVNSRRACVVQCAC